MEFESIRLIGLLFFGLLLAASLSALVFLGLAVHRIRNLNIPPNATFSETLLLTPLSIVIAVDLLDLGLDILAAPLSWMILDRLGLKALRGVAAVEALIPGTQFIPTLTLCWFGARLFGSQLQVFDQRYSGFESISTRS